MFEPTEESSITVLIAKIAQVTFSIPAIQSTISNAPADTRPFRGRERRRFNQQNIGALPRQRVKDRIKKGSNNDPKTEVGKVSALFKEKGSEDRQAEKSWYI